MIDGLIAGKIIGQPKEGQGRNGTYVTARLRVATDGDALFVSVIAFSRTVGAQLMALNDGDSAAISGSLTPKVWQSNEGPRPALDMIAHGVMTPYHVTRKRKAVQGEKPEPANYKPEDDWMHAKL